MKKHIIILVLTLMTVAVHSQGVIELKETTLNYNPVTYDIVESGNTFALNIKENSTGEFEKNPMAFMEKHFNIHSLINQIGDRGYDTYRVVLKSRKGALNAEYDKAGTLLYANLKFTNVLIPYELQRKLYQDYKGWEMVKNQHIAKEKEGVAKIDFYRVKMKKGNKTKNLKFDVANLNDGDVAFNE